jgi:hypothetical protein
MAASERALLVMLGPPRPARQTHMVSASAGICVSRGAGGCRVQTGHGHERGEREGGGRGGVLVSAAERDGGGGRGTLPGFRATWRLAGAGALRAGAPCNLPVCPLAEAPIAQGEVIRSEHGGGTVTRRPPSPERQATAASRASPRRRSQPARRGGRASRRAAATTCNLGATSPTDRVTHPRDR